jgi:glycosyltransferase involved in cell wall biosynthesis
MESLNPPTVSLVIPAYNEEKYIKSCLDSVISSGANFLEIVVVDNGSTDGTKEIAESCENVRVVSEERSGVMFARQRGIDETKGDIVAFIDADTKMLPGWYEQILEKFSKDLILASLSGPYMYENISWWTKILVWIFYYIIVLPTYYILGYAAIFGNFAIRRSVLQKMGGLNTDIVFYGDDTDTVKRAHKFGRTIFSMDFRIKTSPRRFEQEGVVFTAWKYMINFIHIVLFKKPHTHKQTILR